MVRFSLIMFFSNNQLLLFQCQKPFSEEDVVILNAVDKDLNLMITRMEAKQARLKLEKKMKKNVKQEPVEISETCIKSEEIIDTIESSVIRNEELSSKIDVKRENVPSADSKLLAKNQKRKCYLIA